MSWAIAAVVAMIVTGGAGQATAAPAIGEIRGVDAHATAGRHGATIGHVYRSAGLPSVPADTPIALRARLSGHFVTADDAGRSPLIANADSIGKWQTFDLIDTADGYHSLRSHANWRIVWHGHRGELPLIARSDTIGPEEKFKMVNNPNGSISLLAFNNGHFVSTGDNGKKPLIANSNSIGPSEEFDLIRP